MNYSRAIVRTPGRSLIQGITTADLGPPDHPLALVQHRAYVEALESCGLQVQVLEADELHPDSTFVEDVALLTPRCAVVLNPGAPSRRGETRGISRLLAEDFARVFAIQDPGTVEGGDILRVEDHYYIGQTARTNRAGAEQLAGILEEHGYGATLVPVRELLHLKTGISYLEKGVILASSEFQALDLFQDFTILRVPPDEAYAANSLWINGTVLVPSGHPRTAALIQGAGYPVRPIAVSEFQKLDGGLSCLSLRY